MNNVSLSDVEKDLKRLKFIVNEIGFLFYSDTSSNSKKGSLNILKQYIENFKDLKLNLAIRAADTMVVALNVVYQML